MVLLLLEMFQHTLQTNQSCHNGSMEDEYVN